MKRAALLGGIALLAWIAFVSFFHYKQFAGPLLRLLGP